MKIRVKQTTYEYIMSLKRPQFKRPKRPNILFRTLIYLLSLPDTIATNFKYTKHNIENFKNGPYLILMNHSSFIDLEIASRIFYPMPYCVVSTLDGFVGKEWLMHQIGCIPTQKFVTDLKLISDIMHTLHKEKTSVLMYPEAGYSFDGTATAIPKKMGSLVKKLKVPVLSVITDGAFLRQPLYNCLKKRRVNVNAKVSCILTSQEIADKPVEELDEIINNVFTFDNFKSQLDNKIKLDEPFRAKGLERILYRCSNCETEGEMIGQGTTLTCQHCGKTHELTEYGQLTALEGETRFSHIPDWFNWQRACVKKELYNGSYYLDCDVDIGVIVDTKALYMIGSGRLKHDENGFTLTGCDGKLNYHQPPTVSYGLNADYFWYEIGDIISIGNKERLYYCFPKNNTPVAKARLAHEELYKHKKLHN